MRSIPDPAVFERLAVAIEGVAKARGLTFARNVDGNPQVDLSDGTRVLVRDTGSSLRPPSVAAYRSRSGTALGRKEFEVTYAAGVNVWTNAGSTAPTYSDDELAQQVLDVRSW